MLKFYYNVIDTIVDRRHFQLLSTDTVSLYFSLAGTTLEEVIKPEHLASYRK